MSIYSRKSRWKLYLGIAGILIVLTSMAYTRYLADQMAEVEKQNAENFVLAQQQLNDIDEEDTENCDLTLHLQILQGNKTIPVIVVNDRGGIDFAINFGAERDSNQVYLKEQVQKMKEEGFKPVQGFAYEVYYKESVVLQQLRYFPIVQLVLIAAFIALGYSGFSSARRAEQNRVWVGMAKETAHQLGTPISAIIAWIEHLKDIRANDEEVGEVLQELNNDVMRLDLIADRFSKIGSAPKLQPINIYEELDKCRVYMERRAPRKVKFEFPALDAGDLKVQINPPLFDWVVENLLRNALDAMEGRGLISAQVTEDKNFVHIDISDSGKGIPSSKFKTVFQPGYTTKKRGWGLGLSLAKRIIEEYHSGKIFVKKSIENKGTTFSIKLPK